MIDSHLTLLLVAVAYALLDILQTRLGRREALAKAPQAAPAFAGD